MNKKHLSQNFSVHTLSTLPHLDSYYDEEDSYHVLNELINKFSDYCVYDSNKNFTLQTVKSIADSYALFHASVTHGDAVNLYINVPLSVFRYLMLEDLTWSYYEAIRRKPGYVVEGMFWTNGMIYQVREDKKDNFDIYQVCVYIDRQTARKFNYPILPS
jgi:hypothetical protein